ncbi:MAG: hypothetical protein IJU50_09150 [Lachnospiraceae bacterium]|nr:hypothetical protein [Lachnospiraceae bacterium]
MMKNSYMELILTAKNEFRAEAAFQINGMFFDKVNVKIDTGCPRTSMPMLKLGLSDFEAYKLKAQDCGDKSIAKSISFGVNDSKQKKEEDKKKFKAKRYMELGSISFRHTAKNFVLDDLDMGDIDVLVSYDRVGNILIGMDILKNLEIHIGTLQTGETVLLACQKGDLSDEYRERLNQLFDVRRLV